MGRFLNEDTVEGQIGNPLTLNIYAYVNNNPMGYVDPTGHITESYNDGALRNLLQDARTQMKSKSGALYSKAKAKVTEIYGNFVDDNTYNYLFDLMTKTSPYGNSTGKSYWAIEQLVSSCQAYELNEYITTMAMGSMSGAVGSGGKGSKGLPSARWINNDVFNELKKLQLDKKFVKEKGMGYAKAREGADGIISLTEKEIVKYKGNTYN